jgi:ABC-type multidrug transport system ATPase subunit
VTELLDILGLSHIGNTLVGDSLQRGISGGELKRLSIAVELLTSPTLMLLDEVTSGLDSVSALEVMRFIKKLTSGGISTLCSIHQPSAEIMEMVDDIVLLSHGRLLFAGIRYTPILHKCAC